MRSLYTLPHDAERDTYLVLNDFGASRLRLATSATGKQKAAVRLRLAFA